MSDMIEAARLSVSVLRDHTRMLGQMDFRERDTHVMTIHRALDALHAEVIALTAERDAWEATLLLTEHDRWAAQIRATTRAEAAAKTRIPGFEAEADRLFAENTRLFEENTRLQRERDGLLTAKWVSSGDAVAAATEENARLRAEHDALSLTLQLRDDQVVRTQRALMQATVAGAQLQAILTDLVREDSWLKSRVSAVLTPAPPALPLTDDEPT